MPATNLEMSQTEAPCDVLIVAALREEVDAVLEVSAGAVPGGEWVERRSPHGLLLWVREFEAKEGRLRIAVTQSAEMGQAAATNAAVPLLRELRVRCLAMCGVCAGWKDKVNLGDLIVGERVWTYDVGKIERMAKENGQEEEHFYADIKTYNLDPRWKQKAERFAVPQGDWLSMRPPSFEAQEDWLLSLLLSEIEPIDHPEGKERCPHWNQVLEQLWKKGDLVVNDLILTEQGRARAKKYRIVNQGKLKEAAPFKIHVGPLGTGSAVVEDRTIFSKLRSLERKVLGLEMEAASIGMMAEIQGISHQIVMKAVMDFANGDKNDIFKPFAARASAECLIAFLRENLPPRGTEPFPEDILVKGTVSPPSITPKPSDLLRADYGVVPFYGREEILEELEAWRKSSDKVRVRLIHAPGGMGKSRLMIHWAEQVRSAGQNWMAGFLREPLRDGWFERLSSRDQPMLIVIDYAERWANLWRILEPLIRHDQSRGVLPVRVVLLARNDKDWWEFFKKSDGLLGELLLRDPPIQLLPLAVSPEQRHEIFMRACSTFAAIRRKVAPTRSPVSLEGPPFERVLYLLMAALIAVEGWPDVEAPFAVTSEIPRGVSPNGERIMAAVLDHEERFWQPDDHLTRGQKVFWMEAAQEIVSGVTLLDGLGKSACESLASRLLREPEILQLRGSLLLLLHQIYGREEDGKMLYIAPLMPDLLGEAMVERTLRRNGLREDFLAAVFDGQQPMAITHGLEVLGAFFEFSNRSIIWLQQVLIPLEERASLALQAAKRLGDKTAFARLGDLLVEQLKQAPVEVQRQVAEALSKEGIPDNTVSLRRLAGWVAESGLHGGTQGIEGRNHQTEKSTSIERARRLAEAGQRALDEGLINKSIDHLRESLHLVNGVIEDNDLVGRAMLAGICGTLANALHKGGQLREAFEHIQYAFQIASQLAGILPDVFLPLLANTAHDLASILGALGQRKRALEVAQKAVSIRRKLAETNPEILQDLAASMEGLANRFSEMGQREIALKTALEAVSLRRDLAKKRPDAFLPSLAASLDILANRSSDVGKKDQALEAAFEAVSIKRGLVGSHSEAFLHDLAISLMNLAYLLNGLGRKIAALDVALESANLLQSLADKQRGAFLSDLATSLSNLAGIFSEIGQIDKALEVAQKSVSLRRKLAGEYPEAFLPYLATGLNNQAAFFSKIGQNEQALKVAQEAIGLCRALVNGQRDAFLPDLAAGLTNLAGYFDRLGQGENALSVAQEAAALYRGLVSKYPDAFLPNLSASLKNLATFLRNSGRGEQALANAQEAVKLYRKLEDEHPGAFTPDLAMSLEELSNCYCFNNVNELQNALQVAKEAVALCKSLVNQHPTAFLPDLGSCLGTLALRNSGVGKWQQAVVTAQESSQIYRELANKYPDVFLPELAKSLNNLANYLIDIGNADDALSSSLEALGISWPFFEKNHLLYGVMLKNISQTVARSANEVGLILSNVYQPSYGWINGGRHHELWE